MVKKLFIRLYFWVCAQKQLLFLWLCLAFQPVFAQVNMQWQTRYTSTGSFSDKAEDMVMDAAGNVYVTGVARGASGTLDYVTIKYNSAGVQQWRREYNGTGNGLDEAHAIAIDPAGNYVYVTGWSYRGGATGYDFLTIKYSASSGFQQWAMAYNGLYNGTDEAIDVGVDAAGNVYITGYSEISATVTEIRTIKYDVNGYISAVDAYSGSGISAPTAMLIDRAQGVIYVTGYTYRSASQDYNFITIRLSTALYPQWRVQYNGPSGKYDQPEALDVDAQGNLIVAGYSLTATPGNYNYAIVKYNTSGAQVWDKAYNGAANKDDRANDVKTDAAGNIYVTGRSVAVEANAADIVTIKYDKNGNLKWTATYNGVSNNYDEGKSLAIDDNGNVYVAGSSYNTGSSNDYIIIKYDSTGVKKWSTVYNGTGNSADNPEVILLDQNQNVYVTGSSIGLNSSEDYLTVKYCQFTASAGNDVSICAGASTVLNAFNAGAVSYSWSPAAGLSNPSIATPVATPAVTTSYVVSVTNSAGCVFVDTVVVTVNPLPEAGITADGSTVFCQGKNVKLTTVAAKSYQWSTSPNDTLQSITVSTSGTYSVTVRDSNNCTATDSIKIKVNPLPVVNAGADTSVCKNIQVQLSASGAATYSWHPGKELNDSTLANPFTTPLVTTVYTVTGIDTNGCQNKDTVIITVKALPVVDAGENKTICAGESLLLNGTGDQDYSWIPGKTLNDSTISKPVATPLTTTTYTLITTGSNGCKNSDTVRVIVNKLPVINVGADISICKGMSVGLTANGVLTYKWQPGATLNDSLIYNPIATPVTTTTYTVTGKDSNGCSNSGAIEVIVFPLPQKPSILTKNDSLVCTHSYNSYQWYYSNAAIPGADKKAYQYTKEGFYYIIVSDNTGCSNKSDSLFVKLSGIGEKDNTIDQVKLFPNPTTGGMVLEMNVNYKETIYLTISTVSGQIVYQEELKQIAGAHKHLLDLQAYTPGIYYLQLLSNNNSITRKIIKE